MKGIRGLYTISRQFFWLLSLTYPPSIDSIFTGAPPALNPEQLQLAAAAAKKTTAGITSRHSSSFGRRALSAVLADPEGGESSEDGGEETDMQLWRLLPQLKDLPEAMLKKLPLSAMFQLNAALQKEKKCSEKLGVNSRLAQNAKKATRSPVTIGESKDNRKDLLHPARFLGGASCSLAEQWAAARAAFGETGVLALGNYDLDAVGCGGCVSPKAWLELHNPASQELKLKMFHLPNVGNSGLSSKKSQEGEEGDSLKEIADLESFKSALNTAREAMTSALPWNRSIGAIMGLMVNSSYMQEDLGGNPRRAAVLTEFTDYVLGRNALNWENCQPFLSTDELSHVWCNWKAKRGIMVKPQEKKKEKGGQEGKKVGSDVCKLWNLKVCKAQADKECKTPWGRTLKHACNKFLVGGKICLKDHARIDHV